ncbi:hypothetical protein GOP47_0027819 [Adiantum capillus-veneris]|nr:hypothetical protein GOP47_0027819 [Adiantum capillus-veneris]
MRSRVWKGLTPIWPTYVWMGKSRSRWLATNPAEGWQQPKTAKEEAPQVAFSESPPQLPQHMPSQYPAPTQAHYPPPPPLPQIQAYTTQSMVPLPSTTNAPPAANQQPYPPAVQHIPPQ